MIVAEFDIVCISLSPDKTNAPLIVHADRMLAGAAILRCPQAVSGRNPEIFQAGHRIDLKKLHDGLLRNIRRNRA
jgi:hypothetical protein